MKSKVFFIVLFIMSTCFTSVFCGCQSTNNISGVVFASSASYELNSFSARVGDIILLDDNKLNILPENTGVNAIFSSSNSSIASVNALTGEITCLNEGVAIIYGRIKKDEANFVGDSFTLTVEEELIYATGFSLENEEKIVVGLEETTRANALVYFGENVSVKGTVSYSISGIASFDILTGIITPITLGETTVFVTLILADESVLTKSFTVTVVDRIFYIDAKTTYEVSKNTSFYITYKIKDNTQENELAVLQQVSSEIVVGENLVTIVQTSYQAILLTTGSETGTAILKITSCSDATIYKEIGIIIS